MPPASLRVTEIFYSLQGEAATTGLPTAFIRLTGCPLRCRYCDTAYAFTGGEPMSLQQIIDKITPWHPRYVCVTGGEPLAQKNCRRLLSRLCDNGYHVSLETSGAMDVADIDERVSRIMDLKTPDSGESGKNRLQNINLLNARDRIKMVISSRRDYEWACDMLQRHRLQQRCEVLFSPNTAQQPAAELADWIIEDNLPVRFQLQLHKILWGEQPGR